MPRAFSAAFAFVTQVIEKDAEPSRILDRIRLRLITDLHMPSDEVALPEIFGATAMP